MQQQQQEQLDTTHHATVRSRESASLPAAAVAGRAPRVAAWLLLPWHRAPWQRTVQNANCYQNKTETHMYFIL
jgi:hypothetical protein